MIAILWPYEVDKLNGNNKENKPSDSMAIINVFVEQQQPVPTCCYYHTPSDLLLHQNKRKCSRHQSLIHPPQVHLFICPLWRWIWQLFPDTPGQTGEMECVLQYVFKAEVLAYDCSRTITHQQFAGAWPSMSEITLLSSCEALDPVTQSSSSLPGYC